MNDEQRLRVDDCRKQLSQDLDYVQLKDFIRQEGALQNTYFETVENKEANTTARNLALLDKLKTTDDGWNLLCDYLKSHMQIHLLHLLDGTLRDEAAAAREAPECILRLQRHLVNEYTRSPKSPLHIFQTSRKELFSDATYVLIEMVAEQELKVTSQEPRHPPDVQRLSRISDNKQLLSTLHCKESSPIAPFLIFGQPGQGKTTFVHKLAYDWATAHNAEQSDEIVLTRITLLFAFPLRNLKGDHEDILDFLLESSKLFQSPTSAELTADVETIKEWIYQNPNKVLVILDGYDEINVKCAELERILGDKDLYPPPFPLIVTTRPYAIPKTSPWETRYQICDLTADQVCEFVEKRGAGYPKVVVHELVAFCQADENAFLLSSPFLLHLLCWVVFTPRNTWDEDTTTMRLPCSQTESYIRMIELMSQRQILLFATGVAWATKPMAANDIQKIVCQRLLCMLLAKRDAGMDFDLTFLKAFWRETNDADGRERLRDWAKANAATFADFAEGYLRETVKDGWMKGLYVFPLMDALLTFGVALASFRSIDVSGCSFLFGISPIEGGELLYVCEFGAPVRGLKIKKAKKKGETIEVSEFRFDGTAHGLANFLRGAVGVRCSGSAHLLISQTPYPNSHVTPASTPRSCKSEPPKVTHAKPTFASIVLRLSSQLDAREVENVCARLPVCGVLRVDNMSFFADGHKSTPTNVLHRMATVDEETETSIFVKNLVIGYPTVCVTPTLAAFESFLGCVRQIDTIRVFGNSGDTALLLDAFAGKRQDHDHRRVKSRARQVSYAVYSSSLFRVGLASFVVAVKATDLQIVFMAPSSIPSSALFDDFCTALLSTAAGEEDGKASDGLATNSPRRVHQLTISILFNDAEAIQLVCATIVDPLVSHLGSSKELRLKLLILEDETALQRICSLFPAHIRDRVELDKLDLL